MTAAELLTALDEAALGLHKLYVDQPPATEQERLIELALTHLVSSITLIRAVEFADSVVSPEPT
jgi:hypothetical protein